LYFTKNNFDEKQIFLVLTLDYSFNHWASSNICGCPWHTHWKSNPKNSFKEYSYLSIVLILKYLIIIIIINNQRNNVHMSFTMNRKILEKEKKK